MAETRPIGDRDFDGYLRAEANNLEQIRRLPAFSLVEQVGVLYERSAGILPPDTNIVLRQLFVACHQALLSAAATIGRARPSDAIGVTRRAVETALTAAAIKHDPANLKRWLSTEERLSRWEERLKGKRAKRQPKGGIVYPTSALVESLARQKGILSDAGAHFTPEFYSTLRRHVLNPDAPAGELRQVRFDYFESSQREIERSLMALATVHLQIILLFDESCFEGAFSRAPAWTTLHQEIRTLGRALAGSFQAEAEGDQEA